MGMGWLSGWAQAIFETQHRILKPCLVSTCMQVFVIDLAEFPGKGAFINWAMQGRKILWERYYIQSGGGEG